jgi:hypothetical protein
MITPLKRGECETFVPEMRMLRSDAELEKAHKSWSQSRTQFNRALAQGKGEALEEKWQRDYMQGTAPGDVKAPQHQVKLVVREFKDFTSGGAGGEAR